MQPDIISHLSDSTVGTEEKKFQDVVTFLFNLIEKDRQTTCIVDKLCQRFRAAVGDERQWRDLSYCLTLLNYSEKSFAKLNDNLICFADKLTVDKVYDCIKTIIEKTRKIPNMKPEFKQMIDEFEHKVEECHNRGLNDNDVEIQAIVGTPTSSSASKKAAAKPSAAKAPRTSKKAKPKRVPKQPSSASDDAYEEDDDFVPQRPARGDGKRIRRQKIQQLFVDSSSEEDE